VIPNAARNISQPLAARQRKKTHRKITTQIITRQTSTIETNSPHCAFGAQLKKPQQPTHIAAHLQARTSQSTFPKLAKELQFCHPAAHISRVVPL
jgi:hypothetical protein